AERITGESRHEHQPEHGPFGAMPAAQPGVESLARRGVDPGLDPRTAVTAADRECENRASDRAEGAEHDARDQTEEIAARDLERLPRDRNDDHLHRLGEHEGGWAERAESLERRTHPGLVGHEARDEHEGEKEERPGRGRSRMDPRASHTPSRPPGSSGPQGPPNRPQKKTNAGASPVGEAPASGSDRSGCPGGIPADPERRTAGTTRRVRRPPAAGYPAATVSSCFAMIRRIGTIIRASTAAAATSETVVAVKSCGICSSRSGSTFPPTSPAIRLPTAEARNQIPITCPTYFRGESFVIDERPTGLRHSSPTVWKK